MFFLYFVVFFIYLYILLLLLLFLLLLLLLLLMMMLLLAIVLCWWWRLWWWCDGWMKVVSQSFIQSCFGSLWNVYINAIILVYTSIYIHTYINSSTYTNISSYLHTFRNILVHDLTILNVLCWYEIIIQQKNIYLFSYFHFNKKKHQKFV